MSGNKMLDHAGYKHEMFADSMLETSWAQRSNRSWSTFTSFGLQAMIAGLLMLIPILTPTAMPFLRPISTPMMLGFSPKPPNTTHIVTSAFHETVVSSHTLMLPNHMPTTIFRDSVDSAPSTDPSGPYVPGGIPDVGDPRGLPLFGSSSGPVVPQPLPTATNHPLRLSHMSEGDLIRKVQPVYPALARGARIQGQVVLSAIISKAGTIENLRLLSGHPMLVHAAIDAVSQWRYRPYILNGEPVEVETQITVNFSLSGS